VSEERYSIGELAERAGVSRRTVRFYVQRGLLPPPLGRGRGEHYDATHLAAVSRVKALQLAGASLDEIRARLTPGGAASVGEASPAYAAPAGPQDAQCPGHVGVEGWYIRQAVLPGVELHLSAGHPPLDERQLAALAAFLYELSTRGDQS